MAHFTDHETSLRRERAVLFALFPAGTDRGVVDERMDELAALTETAGADVVDRLTQLRPRPSAATLIGKGKVEELAALAEFHDADVLVAGNDLGPSQGRTIEEATGRRVVDRTELILDIFAGRATTRQAVLQVELAQLEYMLPRLRRMWSHLERERLEGAVGARGPGETQLETDRRIARRRIRDLKQRLEEIGERRRRMVDSRSDAFTVSLVGYTNAGKSSLMNALTDAEVPVRDRLFHTLDTRTREWDVDTPVTVLLSDTVGFIRDLPHHLVASFHATLEEALDADMVLHVIDPTGRDPLERSRASESVLREIGIDPAGVVPIVNKVDMIEDAGELQVLLNAHPEAITVSARTGEGLDRLEEAVRERAEEGWMAFTARIPAGDGATLAGIEAHADVTARDVDGNTVILHGRLPRPAALRLERDLGDRIALGERAAGAAAPDPADAPDSPDIRAEDAGDDAVGGAA